VLTLLQHFVVIWLQVQKVIGTVKVQLLQYRAYSTVSFNLWLASRVIIAQLVKLLDAST